MSHRIGSIGNVIRFVRTLGWDSMITSSAIPRRLRSKADRPGRGSPQNHAVNVSGGAADSRAAFAFPTAAAIAVVISVRRLASDGLLHRRIGAPRSLRMR